MRAQLTKLGAHLFDFMFGIRKLGQMKNSFQEYDICLLHPTAAFG